LGVLVEVDAAVAGGDIGLGRTNCAGGGGDWTVTGRPSDGGLADDEDEEGFAGLMADLMSVAPVDDEDGRDVRADEPEASRSWTALLS
jgi:hypothetical protein